MWDLKTSHTCSVYHMLGDTWITTILSNGCQIHAHMRSVGVQFGSNVMFSLRQFDVEFQFLYFCSFSTHCFLKIKQKYFIDDKCNHLYFIPFNWFSACLHMTANACQWTPNEPYYIGFFFHFYFLSLQMKIYTWIKYRFIDLFADDFFAISIA